MTPLHSRQALLLDVRPPPQHRAMHHQRVPTRISDRLEKLVGLQRLFEFAGVTLVGAYVQLSVDFGKRHALLIALGDNLKLIP